jgi:hypothetical protein
VQLAEGGLVLDAQARLCARCATPSVEGACSKIGERFRRNHEKACEGDARCASKPNRLRPTLTVTTGIDEAPPWSVYACPHVIDMRKGTRLECQHRSKLLPRAIRPFLAYARQLLAFAFKLSQHLTRDAQDGLQHGTRAKTRAKSACIERLNIQMRCLASYGDNVLC